MQNTSKFKIAVLILILLNVSAILALLFYSGALEKAGEKIEQREYDRTIPNNKSLTRLSNNSALIYELNPGAVIKSRGTMQIPVPEYLIEINKEGFRGKSPLFFKGCSFRIIFLGDSFTFGDGLKIEDTYSYRLVSKLNKGKIFCRYEPLNFAVPAYNTAQELELLKTKGLQYEPDAVFIGYLSNDLINNTRKIEIEKQLEDSYQQKNISRNNISEMEYRITEYNLIFSEITAKPFPEAWKSVNESFAELKKITDERNIKVIIMYFPSTGSYENEQISALNNLCYENGWLFIDLSNLYWPLQLQNETIHPSSAAPSKTANEIYAEYACREIIEKKLLK
jgi:hypothetical protein